MLDENEIKKTIIDVLYQNSDPFETSNIAVLDALRKSELYIEYTSMFTRKEWNTYAAILHIKAHTSDLKTLESNKNKILNIAQRIFGRDTDYILTDVEIDILLNPSDIIDLTEFDKTETTKKTIEDAELLMKQGNYTSAIDRVHTTIHGYLRWKLEKLGLEYFESDTIMQLYSKIHIQLDIDGNNDIAQLIKTAIRSASGVIDSINTARNKHSLSHPNKVIIGNSEAKLVISLVKNILEYLENVKEK